MSFLEVFIWFKYLILYKTSSKYVIEQFFQYREAWRVSLMSNSSACSIYVQYKEVCGYRVLQHYDGFTYHALIYALTYYVCSTYDMAGQSIASM